MALETITVPEKDSLKACPCCKHTALVVQLDSSKFPCKIGCSNTRCGLGTPWLRNFALASSVWNRRSKRVKHA